MNKSDAITKPAHSNKKQNHQNVIRILKEVIVIFINILHEKLNICYNFYKFSKKKSNIYRRLFFVSRYYSKHFTKFKNYFHLLCIIQKSRLTYFSTTLKITLEYIPFLEDLVTWLSLLLLF